MRQAPGMTARDWALLVLLSVIWGGSFLFIKLGLRDLPPLTFVFGRVSLAALALAAYLALSGIRFPRERAVWLAFFGMGVLNNLIPFTLLFWGETRIGGGLASILNATTPIFSIILAHLLTADERITPQKLGGILLGFAGVFALIGGGLVGPIRPSMPAMIACLGAAFSYGLAGVFGRRFRRMGLAPAMGAFGQTAASSMLMLPIALIVDRPWQLPMPGATTWASLLGLALLCTTFGYILFFRILAAGGAVNSSLVTLLVPVSGVLLNGLLLGETLGAAQFAGMALIAFGLLVIDGRIFRLRRRSAPA
ncbi:DMT family transporter [Acidisoma silvae]|nr:DMT family transporter [Acidisoma silvae]